MQGSARHRPIIARQLGVTCSHVLPDVARVGGYRTPWGEMRSGQIKTPSFRIWPIPSRFPDSGPVRVLPRPRHPCIVSWRYGDPSWPSIVHGTSRLPHRSPRQGVNDPIVVRILAGATGASPVSSKRTVQPVEVWVSGYTRGVTLSTPTALHGLGKWVQGDLDVPAVMALNPFGNARSKVVDRLDHVVNECLGIAIIVAVVVGCSLFRQLSSPAVQGSVCPVRVRASIAPTIRWSGVECHQESYVPCTARTQRQYAVPASVSLPYPTTGVGHSDSSSPPCYLPRLLDTRRGDRILAALRADLAFATLALFFAFSAGV